MTSSPALPPALPSGSVLAHVGIHKTGTTALQATMSMQRAVLREHGVTYPGKYIAHHGAALALSGTPWGPVIEEAEHGDPERWPRLVEWIQAAPDRSVVSSEFFGDLRGDAGKQFVRELGPDKIHVVIGIRNLALVLPSMWQQTLKMSRYETFDDWLQRVYLGPRKSKNPRAFWSRFSYGEVAERWAGWVGADRVTMVVLDDDDHSWQPRVFESLLDLPGGTINGIKPKKSNRSLTAGEAEAVRRINELLEGKLDWNVYEPMIREGSIISMVENRKPGRDEAKLRAPQWAIEHAVAEGPAMIEQIKASGIRVLGSLDSLAEMPHRLTTDERLDSPLPVPADLPIEALAQAMVGAIAGAQKVGVSAFTSRNPNRVLIRDATTRSLARALRERLDRAARRRLPGRR